MVEYVTFNNKEWPTTYATNEETGRAVRVAGENLQNELFAGEKYVSDEAKRIDEMMYGYVPDYMIFGSPSELDEYVTVVLN